MPTLDSKGSKLPLKVLVTGARLPAALEILRALHSNGMEVFAGDSLFVSTAGLSRYAAGRLKFPAPAFGLSEFQKAVVRFVESQGIDLIVPVSEEIFFFAQIRADLEKSGARLFAPPLALLRQLHSKWGVLEAAKDCGFRLPETLRVTSESALRDAVKRIPEGILKPEFSRGAYEIFSLPGSPPLFPSETRAWLVQERLRGRELTSYGVAQDGKLLAFSCYEPRYRVGFGASLFFEPRSCAAAERAMQAFVGKHHFTGQLSFDIIEEEGGTIALLECNPRATSGVHFCADRFAAALLEGSLGSKAAPYGACAAKAGVIFFHGWRAFREGKLSELLADLRRARDSCFQISDPIPVLALQLTTLEILIRSLFWPVSARHAFTFDLEWNGSDG